MSRSRKLSSVPVAVESSGAGAVYRWRSVLHRSLTVLLLAGSAVAVSSPPAYAQSTATINGANRLQTIDGFGFSEFFGRSSIMRGSQGLPPQRQQEVLDLLLSPETGAGLSILRLGIASTPGTSIQPTDPGGPDAPPQYVWDGDGDGQVWLAQQAQAYGVSRFYANVWSAPGYMKTNGDQANGGILCGLAGTSCPSGDRRAAYADYLVQYSRFYAQEGITITDLGFTNEPEFAPSYSSMLFTPAQAAEFSEILGPVAADAGLLACCDSFGWNQQRAYTNAIEADPQARAAVQLHTGHTYASPVDGPLPTNRNVWMSEWNPSGSTWNENWDDGSGYDGFTIAEAIHDALTAGNVNAYVYWFGASTSFTRGFIQLDGADYHVSKRLWAMANRPRPRSTAPPARAASGNRGEGSRWAVGGHDGAFPGGARG